MKRQLIKVEDVADIHNLARAAHKAGCGKRDRTDVIAFFNDIEYSLSMLSRDINNERAPYNCYKSFVIRDPKVRTIHAASFPDRVLHHAIIQLAGERIDRRQTSTSYACRVGKGVHASARHVQSCLRRYQWYVKIDIDGYFASIVHQRLLESLNQLYKGEGFYPFGFKNSKRFSTGC